MLEFFGPIDQLTTSNKNFQQVLFTGKNLQLLVMSLLPGEEIGNEVHPEVDQFFRVEKGRAQFVLANTRKHNLEAGDCLVVPAGTYHNVINLVNNAQLKLYTIYCPPNHPAGMVHKTKAESEAAEPAENKAMAAAKKKARKNG